MNRSTLWIGLLMVVLLAFSAGLLSTGGWLFPSVQEENVTTGNSLSAVSTQPPENIGTSSETALTDAPACENNPLTAEEWRQFLADSTTAESERKAVLDRAAGFQPIQSANDSFNAESQTVLAALLPKSSQAASQRIVDARTALADPESTYAALLMNIASGRLNRATEVQIPDYPDVKTVADLLDQLALETSPSPSSLGAGEGSSLVEAGQHVLAGQWITRPVCAHLLVTQSGNQVEQLLWSSKGMTSAAVETGTVSETRKVIGEGHVSPDGNWAAFRSGSQDSGGPVFLLNLETGQWTNLVQSILDHADDPDSLPDEHSPWDVIGWFPDNRRLVASPLDVHGVFLIDTTDFTVQPVRLEGYGMGGSEVVHLAPDGSRLVYISVGQEGVQRLMVLDLSTMETTSLVELSYEQGVIMTPRFAPDSATISWVLQTGAPENGMSHAIQLYSLDTGSSRVLVDGIASPPVTAWSPDGLKMAFTRPERSENGLAAPGQANNPEISELWTIQVQDGQTRQVTFTGGQVHHPTWANDSQTLSYVTGEGIVRLTNPDHPEQSWTADFQAAESAQAFPFFTSGFFIP